MKVTLKFGHHNGERFYKAGEVMECPENLGQSLIRQGIAVLYAEKKEDPAQTSGNTDTPDTPAQTGNTDAPDTPVENGSSGSGNEPAPDGQPAKNGSNGTGEISAAGDKGSGEEPKENEKAPQGKTSPENPAQSGAEE